MKILFTFCVIIIFSLKSTGQKPAALNKSVIEMIRSGKINRNLFQQDGILMADYQSELKGIDNISRYYDSLFLNNSISDYQMTSHELFDFGNTVVDIGNFQWLREKRNESGKYWNVWKKDVTGTYRLFTQAFGFFHKIDTPTLLSFKISSMKLREDTSSFELQAYNALMEKAVRERSGMLRTEFFTDDAIFYPFEDSPKVSKKVLLPYLIAYNSGDVTIPSIKIFTTYQASFGEYILEYNGFNVDWQSGNYQGSTTGKGVRIWRRQPNGSLKILREIGLHDL